MRTIEINKINWNSFMLGMSTRSCCKRTMNRTNVVRDISSRIYADYFDCERCGDSILVERVGDIVKIFRNKKLKVSWLITED